MPSVHARRAASNPASAPGHAPRTRVLVVEDEGDIAGLIRHTLERGGDMVVDVAGSGDQALTMASGQTPDLIILDLNLPVLGGLEVCRSLRSRRETARVPIIMLTSGVTSHGCKFRVTRDGRSPEMALSVIDRGANDWSWRRAFTGPAGGRV